MGEGGIPFSFPPPPLRDGVEDVLQRVDSGFGKAVYAKNFLKTLIPKMMRKREADPSVAEVIDYDRLQKITTIGACFCIILDMIFSPLICVSTVTFHVAHRMSSTAQCYETRCYFYLAVSLVRSIQATSRNSKRMIDLLCICLSTEGVPAQDSQRAYQLLVLVWYRVACASCFPFAPLSL